MKPTALLRVALSKRAGEPAVPAPATPPAVPAVPDLLNQVSSGLTRLSEQAGPGLDAVKARMGRIPDLTKQLLADPVAPKPVEPVQPDPVPETAPVVPPAPKAPFWTPGKAGLAAGGVGAVGLLAYMLSRNAAPKKRRVAAA